MNTAFQKIKMMFADRSLRRRIVFTFFALAIFRVLAAIPIPGIDTVQLQNLLNSNQLLSLFNVFSGGGLSHLSIVMLGVGPYITGSIIMQLLTILSPRLKALYQEEGEAGRKRFSQYSRMLTVPLAAIQGFSFLILLERQGVLPQLGVSSLIVNLVVIIAGSVLLMWIGELVTEFGIGNGLSLIIFAGIIASVPSTLGQLIFAYDPAQLPLYIGFLVAAILVIIGVVIVTEAERPIPVTYAKRVRGMKVYGGTSTYLPLRVNQAGVIPIIFALSLLLFPQMIFSALSHVSNALVAQYATMGQTLFNNPWFYAAIYFVLVFAFTYFYTAVTFDPHTLSTNLQKNGAFIPGVRPGQPTAEYISSVLTRITLVGAVFLGLIAVLPLILRAVTGLTYLAIGGTALLIVVSVVLDITKKVDAQISMREY
ncbi:TPA: preprotein translocase subunit SecY [Candidatus Taylorbacteria bacterium]|nr:preprotein translocase subunit SecY [Candidatus Taylorbacteria bacterium]